MTNVGRTRRGKKNKPGTLFEKNKPGTLFATRVHKPGIACHSFFHVRSATDIVDQTARYLRLWGSWMIVLFRILTSPTISSLISATM